MLNINITNFRKKVFDYIDQTIKFGDPLTISTKNGNAVILSEEEYNGLMETLYLKSIPGMVESLQAGMREPPESMVDADDLEW